METEVFGVNYERFSVGKKLDKLAKKYHIYLNIINSIF